MQVLTSLLNFKSINIALHLYFDNLIFLVGIVFFLSKTEFACKYSEEL